MEQVHVSTTTAGIDVGKRWLDAAVEGVSEQLRIGNEAQGIAKLRDWLHEHKVTRVGLEASGPYGRRVQSDLEAAGFEVVVHQPLEVRLFARLKRQRAKSDRLDAKLIAAATAGIERQAMVCDRECQDFRVLAGGCTLRRHGFDKSFAEDDGELRLCH